MFVMSINPIHICLFMKIKVYITLYLLIIGIAELSIGSNRYEMAN